MNEAFKKIKKRALTEAIVKSSIAGVCAGLFVVGAVLLALKLNSIHINVGFYVLMGAGTAAIVFAVLFYVLRPNEKRLAREYDREHALREKVQTMLEFSGAEGEMIELQRSDTVGILQSLPVRKLFRKSEIWQYALSSVLSAAMFITAVVLPPTTDPIVEEPPPAPFAITEWQISTMNQMISDIESTSLESECKEEISIVLNELLETLQEVELETEMRSAVVGSVEKIDVIISETITYKDFGTELCSSELNQIAIAMVECISLYRGTGVNLSSYEQVKQREALLPSLIGTELEKRLNTNADSLRKQLEVTLAEGLSDVVTDQSLKYGAILASPSLTRDSLYAAFEGYAEGLDKAEQMIQNNYGDESLQQLFNTTVNQLSNDLSSALYSQSYNYLMYEFIRERLAATFEVPTSLFPELVFDDIEGLYNSSPNEPSGSENGGGGSGSTLYGSDDKVFDPDTGEITEYGGLLDEGGYYAKVLDQLRKGDLPEELVSAINKYFDILFSGLEESEDN